MALAATSLWVWQAVYHDEQTKIRDLVQNQAQEIARLIDMEITYHNHALNRMAARWELAGGTDKATWTADAQAHLRDFHTVAAIAWADKESRVRWLEPLAGNEEIIGFDLASHPQGRAVLARVRESGMQASTNAIDVSTIGQGFIVISPVLQSGEIAGYLVGLYRLDRLFDVLSATTRESYRYRVWEGENLIFESDTAPWPEGPGSEEPVSGEMRDGTWKLQLLPRPFWLASQRSNLPILILLSGLFLSAATTVALRLLEAVQRQYEVIQSSEKRLRQIIDSASTGMITVDRAGTICDVNPAAQSQFGYDTKELVGQPLEAFVPGAMVGTQNAEFRQGARLKALRPSGEIQERSALKRNGVTFPVEIALAPFGSREGVQILVLITDITERDEARRRLEAHTRELESTNRDLDDFAYVASHDLRAPLTAIASLVHWIEEDTATLLPPGSAKHLALIKNRVGRMGKLLEDLLDYSRAGRMANEIEFVDTAEMVAQVTDLVRGAAPVTIRTQGLPAFETVRTPLYQVMRNLISNSIKHHDGDECVLEISASEQGPFYVFRVADDGPGIPRQFHKKVFNMFQTLRPRDEVEGSGMGLALVRKVVERYGGYVQLIESDGRGTTVEFTWPKANTEG
jgi:PAS domain S-box-containing protein